MLAEKSRFFGKKSRFLGTGPRGGGRPALGFTVGSRRVGTAAVHIAARDSAVRDNSITIIVGNAVRGYNPPRLMHARARHLPAPLNSARP